MERERKIDLESLSEEDFKNVETALRSKISSIIQKTTEELNRYLNVYGLEMLLGIQVVKQGEANLIKEAIKETPQEELILDDVIEV